MPDATDAPKVSDLTRISEPHDDQTGRDTAAFRCLRRRGWRLQRRRSRSRRLASARPRSATTGPRRRRSRPKCRRKRHATATALAARPRRSCQRNPFALPRGGTGRRRATARRGTAPRPIAAAAARTHACADWRGRRSRPYGRSARRSSPTTGEHLLVTKAERDVRPLSSRSHRRRRGGVEGRSTPARRDDSPPSEAVNAKSPKAQGTPPTC